MDHDLTTNMHWRSFEQLVQALAVQVVAPGVSVFGDGPDGGREATFEGRMNYPSDADSWSGRLVMQAKFRQSPQGNKKDSAWALKELKKELSQTFAKGSKRVRPDYYIFATNVKLSSATDGGKDKAREIAAKYPLNGFSLWDYDQLRTYIDGSDSVRDAFTAFITPGDVLAELKRQLRHATPDFDRLIVNFLEKELLDDQYANLEKASGVDDERIPISRIFIDLPTRSDGSALNEDEDGASFIATTLELAAEKLDLDSQGALKPQSVQRTGQPQRGRLVLIGGPGQGKTTAGQMLCQLFRISVLKSQVSSSLTPETEAAIALMESQCEEEGIELPKVHRFPIRIALTELSDRLADDDGPDSLLEVIAEVVSRRSGQQLSPEIFREWLSKQPWLLVLDGLDEVPATSNRNEVLEAIRDFWVDATQAKSDLLVIATTRPQGYNDDFSPSLYRHVTLRPLSRDLAHRYGVRLARAHHPGEEGRQERISSRLEDALRNEATTNLMTTPLQVAIMTTLVDQGPPPEQKWKLFSQYYEVIYRRELERDIPASRALREHQPDIDAIHRRVALVLQVEDERTPYARAGARMPSSRFAAIVRARLLEEGHEEPGLSEIEGEIIRAAANRLVFLVGLEAGEVGFEIRSLQEFTAAEALMDGDEASVTKRLHAIAGVTSWRNVFLFAAGHCFAERQHLRDTVSTVCRQLNDPVADQLAPVVWPGALLAANLLRDGIARHQPTYARLLAGETMQLLGRPLEAWGLLSLSDESTQGVLAEALERGLGQPGLVRSQCIMLLRELDGQGVDWASRILEDRIPKSVTAALEAAAEEDEALPPEHYIEDAWLPERIDAVTGEMSLAEIHVNQDALARFSEALPENGAVAVAEVLERSSMPEAPFRLYALRGKVEIAELDGDYFSLGVRWLDLDPTFYLDRAIDDTDPETLRAASQGARAARDFWHESTASQLARQLRVVADEVSPGDWKAVATLSSWPMSTAIQYAGGDPTELHRIADLAEGGRLGDRLEWDEAENRWHEQGLTLDDLDYAPEVDAPFDGAIATVGFPVDDSAGFAQLYGGAHLVGPLFLKWLEACRSETLKARLARWLTRILEGQGWFAEPLPASGICEHLSSEVLHGVHYALTLGLDWSDGLSPEEAAGLDRIGRALRMPQQGKRRENENDMELGGPPEALIRNWNDGRQSDGLFRILALGLPSPYDELSEEGPFSEDLTEAPEIAQRNPGAAGLLALKGAWSPERVADAIARMTSVWEVEPIWLWEALDVINGRLEAEPPEVEQAARELWDAAGSASSRIDLCRRLRRELDETCGYLINQRASDLGEASTWDSLGFFARPHASNGDS